MSSPFRVKKILCAVDFSEHAFHALQAAKDLALRMRASVTLMHVFHMPVTIDAGVRTPNEQTYLEAVVASRTDKLAEWQQELVTSGVDGVDMRDELGIPWERIVDAITDGGYDLVVLGTHGRTGIARLLLGSTAERVVRHAACSVLVVRHRAPALPAA